MQLPRLLSFFILLSLSITTHTTSELRHLSPLINAVFSKHPIPQSNKQQKLIQEGFVAGTKIATPDGYNNIEDIKPGDTILGACDGAIIEQEVLCAITQQAHRYLQITFESDMLCCGHNQKIYLPVHIIIKAKRYFI